MNFKYKQVIVVRSDLKLSPGKLAVQVAHASHHALDFARISHEDWVRGWLDEGYRKIVLEASSKEAIYRIQNLALSKGIPFFVVSDFGLTELPPDTVTCVGIGPAPNEEIDKITGNLKLYK